MRKIVIVDVDDCICALATEVVSVCNDMFGSILSLADWTEYDVYKMYGLKHEQYWKLCEKERFFERAYPFGRAKKTLDILEELDYSIFYVTARAWHKDAREITKNWLAKWGFPKGSLHLVNFGESKMKYTMENIGKRIEIVIEDNATQVREFAKCSTVKKVFLIDRPWNKADKDLDPYRINHISVVLQKL